MKKLRLIITVIAIIITAVVCLRIYNVNIRDNNDSSNIVSPILNNNNEKITYEAVTVRYVVDDDTLAVTDKSNNDFKVRLIGCDTPESVSSNENKNCEEGKEASEYTKSLISPGNTVYLQYDAERYDKYERTLAYVWLSEPTEEVSDENMQKYMLNAKLLSEGQAKTLFVGSNTKYKLNFLSFENDAKNNDKGFWNDGNFDKH